MSSVAEDWLVVGIFFLGFFVYTLGEATWIDRHAAIGFGRSFAYAFATNIFAVTVGFSISFVIFAVIMMMAWDGSLETVPGNDVTLWIAVAIAALAPAIVLTLVKQLALRLFKIDQLPGWKYSAIASIAFLLFVISLPVIAGNLIR